MHLTSVAVCTRIKIGTQYYFTARRGNPLQLDADRPTTFLGPSPRACGVLTPCIPTARGHYTVTPPTEFDRSTSSIQYFQWTANQCHHGFHQLIDIDSRQ